jgi:hypothetical protein
MQATGLNLGVMNGERARCIVPATMVAALVAALLLAAAVLIFQPTAETEAYRSVYYAAQLSGRDPDAAVRKARFRAGILVKQFGMSRSDAAADIARFMIVNAGNPCVAD